MMIRPPYKTGTATTKNGSTQVVGIGTGWSTYKVRGGIFFRNGLSEIIESVEDDTHLTLAQPWSGGDGASNYSIMRSTSDAGDVVELHDRMVTALKTLALAGIKPDDLGTLAYRDTLTSGLTAESKFIFLHCELTYELEYYIWNGPKDESWRGPYPVAIPPEAPTSGVLSSNGSIANFISVSQVEYDAIPEPRPATTIYVII